jgi:hypothetical protein
MRLIPAWLSGRDDRALAAGKYAGRQSATDRTRTRNTMGRPHRNARDAANTGEDYRLGQRGRRR